MSWADNYAEQAMQAQRMVEYYKSFNHLEADVKADEWQAIVNVYKRLEKRERERLDGAKSR